MSAHAAYETSEGPRVALIIGNAAYRYGPKLANPPTDAEAIAGAFERLGFSSVTRSLDLDKAAQDQALKRFTSEAKSADMAVIYYAGHGMEMDGENYLLPVDVELSDVSSLGFEATRLSDVMRAVDGARKFRFVILDACRDNPFRGRMQGLEATRSMLGRGLAAIEPPGNTLVAYAARHGTTAKDGAKGQNSPYAAALLNRLETPNLDIRLVLGHVRDDVMTATENQQQPFFYGTLGGAEIQLKRVAIIAPAPALPAGDQAELLRALQEERDWERTLRAHAVKDYEAFRSTWPSGRFADQIDGKVAEALQQQEQTDWDAASKADSIADFNKFRARWPNGKYADEAAAKIKHLSEREGAAAFESVMQAIKYKSAEDLDPAPLRTFLERHPDDSNAAKVANQLETIETKLALKVKEGGRRADALRYLERFPNGMSVQEAKELLSGVGDDRIWIRALGVTSDWTDRKREKAAFENYLEDWPEGRHADEAKKRIEDLTKGQTKFNIFAGVSGLLIWLGGLWLLVALASWALPQIWSYLPDSLNDVRKEIARRIAPSDEPTQDLPIGVQPPKTIYTLPEITEQLLRRKQLEDALKPPSTGEPTAQPQLGSKITQPGFGRLNNELFTKQPSVDAAPPPSGSAEPMQ